MLFNDVQYNRMSDVQMKQSSHVFSGSSAPSMNKTAPSAFLCLALETLLQSGDLQGKYHLKVKYQRERM